MCCYNETINRRCRHTFSEPSFPFLIDINWPRCFLSFIHYWSSPYDQAQTFVSTCLSVIVNSDRFTIILRKATFWLFRSVHHALNVRSVPLNRANSEFHRSVSKKQRASSTQNKTVLSWWTYIYNGNPNMYSWHNHVSVVEQFN